MILAPNIACIAGVFTLGFGIGMSVVTNNVASLAALANGLLPMRRVAQLEAERRHLVELELRQSACVVIDGAPPAPADLANGEGPAPPETLTRLRLGPTRHVTVAPIVGS
jgi:hypothetical protein